MLNRMVFPGKYFQGSNALEQFALCTETMGKSFMLFGTKTALKAARDKIEKSFEDKDVKFVFELSHGRPVNSEYERIEKLLLDSGCTTAVAIGGGGIIDMVRAAALKNGKGLVVVPTTVASDAACTNVSLHYSEDGSTIIGGDLLPRNPDIVIVDTTVLANAPVRMLLAGVGDALATYYEALTCYNNGVEQMGGAGITYTTMKMAELCRDMLFQFGEKAVADCREHKTTPEFEKTVEACAFLSGVACLNAGCSGAHGLGDHISTMPGGHDWLHGERVAVGLVMQLIIEEYDMSEIEKVLTFLTRCGVPATIKDLGYENLEETARFLGSGAENDHLVSNMRSSNHSAAAIERACLEAVRLSEKIKG